jgi:hypothetical protein
VAGEPSTTRNVLRSCFVPVRLRYLSTFSDKGSIQTEGNLTISSAMMSELGAKRLQHGC